MRLQTLQAVNILFNSSRFVGGASFSFFNAESSALLVLTFYLFSLILVLAAGGYAAYTDFKGMIIPNKIPLAILGVFIFHAFLMIVSGNGLVFSLQSHILSGVIVFLATFFIFTAKLMGGGDAKMLAAYSFWFGMKGVLIFLFYTALFGAFVAAAALVIKTLKPIKAPADGSWIQRIQAGESAVPYAIPIFMGAAAGYMIIGFFSIERLQSML